MPELFKPQRRINEAEMPTAEEKLSILKQSIEQLIDAGYVYIGMDHFAKPDDELSIAQQQGKLYRNFQGYATHADCDLVGLGITSIGTIDNSRKAAYGYDQRVEVFGSKGMVHVENQTPNRHVYSSAEGVSSEKPLHFFLERYMDSYVIEMQDFVEAVVNGTTPPVVGEDGRIPVIIGMAALKSMQENRPVRLSEIA